MEDVKKVFPNLPDRIAGLGELAFNLWWSWNPEARMLFKRLDREAWKSSGHNPVKLLKVLPPETLQAAASNSNYLHHYEALMARFHQGLKTKSGWFQENIPVKAQLPIAYFSLEYGLHHSLPFYAGGLGFLAGDHLKEASDLRIPLVAVGFMYPDGYVRQKIDADGWQENVDEVLDRDAAPISRVYNDQGEQLQVLVPGLEPPILVAVWQAMVGRVPLYLMDTNLEVNPPECCHISDHLYVSDREQRLLQEYVLGIGGSEVLRTLGVGHSVIHLNEGHAAFALLERIRERLEGGMSYEAAVKQVKETSVFTAHTPVAAGHDVFPFELMDKYFKGYYPLLGLDRDSFMKLGISPDAPDAGFNMTAFALRMSAYHNGVSKKHGEVSRKMWHLLWPELPEDQVPIDYITNGVHVPTWVEPKMELLLNRYLGPNWLAEHDNPDVWEMVADIPYRELWDLHCWLKTKLINFIRHRVRLRWVEDRIATSNIITGGTLLDPAALTLGFARRMVTYKRAELIFHDVERLKRILNNPWQPVQIIFAGKAHPADDPGKQIIQRIFNFARNPDLGGRIALVEDYGEHLAQYLVHGVDVWLNNPRPPLEASGTSGMKASLNGVLNLSILDGWWLEGFNGENGWAFGAEGGDDREAQDAEALYTILEKEVVPLYYHVDKDGIPRDWVIRMKEAMKSTGPVFSARRMVKEYARKAYQQCLECAF